MAENKSRPSIYEIITQIRLPVVPGRTDEAVRLRLIEYAFTFRSFLCRSRTTFADERDGYLWQDQYARLHSQELRLAHAGLNGIAGVIVEKLLLTS